MCDPTVKEVFDSMSDDQKECLYGLVEYSMMHNKLPNNTQLSGFSINQKIVVNFICKQAVDKIYQGADRNALR